MENLKPVTKLTYTECITAIRDLSYKAPDSETKRSLERLADNVSARHQERLAWLKEQTATK